MLEQAMSGPYYTLESLEACNSVGYLLKRCGIIMTQIAEQRFVSQPISFIQWVVLMRLAQDPYLSPTEISTHLGYDMGALTRIVDDLQEKKLVHRERSERDRRAVQIALTPEGRRLALSAKATVVDLANELVVPYTKAETDMLISLLNRLLGHMEGMVDGSAAKPPAAAARTSSARRVAAPASVKGAPRKVRGGSRK
jgi:DNA-binding MarR family transcriptional regulator